jgi:hypothetical protein
MQQLMHPLSLYASQYKRDPFQVTPPVSGIKLAEQSNLYRYVPRRRMSVTAPL